MELRSLKLTLNCGSKDVAKILFKIVMGLVVKQFTGEEEKDKKKVTEAT